jgi:hypothetical protein
MKQQMYKGELRPGYVSKSGANLYYLVDTNLRRILNCIPACTQPTHLQSAAVLLRWIRSLSTVEAITSAMLWCGVISLKNISSNEYQSVMSSPPDIRVCLVPPELLEYPDMNALEALVGTPEGRAWVDRRWQQHLADIQAKPEGARSSWETVELQKPAGWLYTKLSAYYRDAVKGQGAVKRQYHFTAKADRKVARMYTGERTGAAQNLETKLRSLLFCGKVFDLDMVNCQPTVMCQLAEQLGLRCPKLQLIVERRKEQLEIVQQIKGVDYKLAKQFVIAFCNGGGATETHPYLRSLYQECQCLLDAVSSAYPDVYAFELAKNMRAKLTATRAQEKARRTTVSRVYQCIESQLLMALYDFCVEHDLEVMALIFDGMLITRKELPAAFLSDARTHMHQRTGFYVELKVKPMQQVTLADVLPQPHAPSELPAVACRGDDVLKTFGPDDTPQCARPVQQMLRLPEGHRMVVPAAGDYPLREWTCDKGYLKSAYICERAREYALIAVDSGMGTGKSEAMIAIIKQYVTARKSVVVHCQRKSDVQSMTKRLTDHGLDFVKYSDLLKGAIHMCEYPLLVMEWESSYRIQGAVHLTLMDEMRSMCAAMTSRTNGDNMISNMDRLYHDVCRPDTQIVALCADLTVDDCAMDLLQRLVRRRLQWQISVVDGRRADAKARALVCTHRLQLPGIDAESASTRLGCTQVEVQLQLVHAETEEKEHRSNLIELMDRSADPMSSILFIKNDQTKICRNVRYINFARCLLQLQIDVSEGRKLFVSCGSNRTARMMHTFLSQLQVNGRSAVIGLYTGDSDNGYHFGDVDLHWKKNDVTVCNGTVSTGIDYNELIWRIYVFPSVRADRPRDTHQRGGRARKMPLESGCEIWYAWNGGIIPVVTRADQTKRYEQCLARIHACDKARAVVVDELKEPVKFTIGVSTYEAEYKRAPDDLMMLRAYNMMEASYTTTLEDFASVFKYQADRKGYGCVYGDADLPQIDDVLQLAADAKAAYAVVKSEMEQDDSLMHEGLNVAMFCFDCDDMSASTDEELLYGDANERKAMFQMLCTEADGTLAEQGAQLHKDLAAILDMELDAAGRLPQTVLQAAALKARA